MKARKILMAIAAVGMMASCSRLDEMSSRIDQLSSRVDDLEIWQEWANYNIVALKTTVDALSEGDYITNIKEIKEGDKVVGYEIVFKNHGSIKIYHGKDGVNGTNGTDGKDGADGKDGHSPVIGIAEVDGVPYWTLDGEWILDSKGNKIQASGKDGVTPQFKIENGDWYITYDGVNWTYYGQATGNPGGDSIFSDVYEEDGQLVLKLRNGKTYYVPVGSVVSIEFDTKEQVVVKPGEKRSINYTITSSTGKAQIEVLSGGNVKAKVTPATDFTGTIDVTTGTTLDADYDKVVVLVSNGDKMIMRRLTFQEAGLVIDGNDTRTVGSNGGSVTLEFFTNTEFEVIIPAEAASWIALESTKAMESHNAVLAIAQNTAMSRKADVQIRSKAASSLCLTYHISQEGAMNAIVFTSNLKTVTIPTISGTSVSGVVDWGDGTTATWSQGLSKTFSSATSHTISVGVSGASSFTFSNLTGVTAIDLSNF